MKKIFLSTMVLMGFAFSLILVQLSCKKNAIAQAAAYVLPIASKDNLGGVMVDGTSIVISKEGKISAVSSVTAAPIEYNEVIYIKQHGSNGKHQLWKVNMDGSNNQAIPIVLPAGIEIEYKIGVQRTSKKIIFGTKGPDFGYVYTSNLDGTEVKRIAEVDDDFTL